jgi:hypothetical protein
MSDREDVAVRREGRFLWYRSEPAAICGRWSMGTTLAFCTPWMST